MEAWIVASLVALWVVVLANLAVTAALVRRAVQPPAHPWSVKPGLEAGAPVPDFEASTGSGQDVRLSDLWGRSLLLFLLSPGCSPCRAIAPAVVRFAERTVAQRAQLAVAVFGSPEASREALPQLFEDGLTVLMPKADAEQVRATFRVPVPAWCAISEQGTVVESGMLMDREEQWQRLEAALAGAPAQ